MSAHIWGAQTAVAKAVVYRELEGELTGSSFEMPRRYGHAVYTIAGGHAAWKTTRDASKVYGYLDEAGQWRFEYRHSGCCCLAVVREGGYDGPANPDRTLEQLLEPYRQRILALRSSAAASG